MVHGKHYIHMKSFSIKIIGKALFSKELLL